MFLFDNVLDYINIYMQVYKCMYGHCIDINVCAEPRNYFPIMEKVFVCVCQRLNNIMKALWRNGPLEFFEVVTMYGNQKREECNIFFFIRISLLSEKWIEIPCL